MRFLSVSIIILSISISLAVGQTLAGAIGDEYILKSDARDVFHEFDVEKNVCTGKTSAAEHNTVVQVTGDAGNDQLIVIIMRAYWVKGENNIIVTEQVMASGVYCIHRNSLGLFEPARKNLFGRYKKVD